MRAHVVFQSFSAKEIAGLVQQAFSSTGSSREGNLLWRGDATPATAAGRLLLLRRRLWLLLQLLAGDVVRKR